MAQRCVRAAFAVLLGGAACTEVRGVDAPPLEAGTQSVVLLRGSIESDDALGWAYTRAGFETARLPPLVVREGERPPTLWLEYFDETLEALELSGGPFSAAAEGTCGARPIPSGTSRYRIQQAASGFEFVRASAGAAPPWTHFEGPCPCPELEFELIEQDELCRPQAVLTRDGRLLAAGRLSKNCDVLDDRPAVLVEIALSTGQVVSTSTSPTHEFVTAAYSFDGQRIYWGDISGRLRELHPDGRIELLFEAPIPTGDLRLVTGGISEGALQLILALEARRASPNTGRTESAILYRYRTRERSGELLYPPMPSSDDTRQQLLVVWVSGDRILLFPEDEVSWIDIRATEATRRNWTALGSPRAATVLPNGDTIVGTYGGTFHVLERGATAWRPADGLPERFDDAVLAVAAVDDRELWYFIGNHFVGRRIDGQACSLVPISGSLKKAQILVRGDDIAIVGERDGETGSTIVLVRSR